MRQFESSTFAQPERMEPRHQDGRRAGGHFRSRLSLFVRRPAPSEAQLQSSDIGHIRSPVLSFRNMHEFGDLLIRYLEARKSVFIDRLNWCVSEKDGMEFDQYDTPWCRWVILHEFGEVIGGVRLMPTTARCGIYSYMLRDAQLGILDDLPTDVLFLPAPVSPTVWEASRFFIVETVPAARRMAVQQLLFRRMRESAAEHGARILLGIVPSVWSRWARRIDATATPIGAKFSIDGTSSQSVLFNVQGQAPGLARKSSAA